MNRRPITPRSAIRKALVLVGMVVGMLVGGFVASVYPAVDHAQPSPAYSVDPATVKGTAQWTIKRNDCVEATGGVLPSAVVMTAQDGRWTYSDKARSIDVAFEQLVHDGLIEANEFTKGVDHGVRIAQFCR